MDPSEQGSSPGAMSGQSGRHDPCREARTGAAPCIELPPAQSARRNPGATFLFLSPHLDDVALSCGALASTLAKSCRVVVATVFSEATEPPHTLAARTQLRRSGWARAADLYRERRNEDIRALERIGAEPLHLGAADAIFRRRERAGAASRWLGCVFPEFLHSYPTYRFGISRGRVSHADLAVVRGLDRCIRQLIGEVSPNLVFAPLGVGRHVDHVMVRDIVSRTDAQVCYYEDLPYAMFESPDRDFLARHHLRSWTWDEGLAEKRDLVEAYRTQVAGLFPRGVRLVAERYHSPTSVATSEVDSRGVL